MRAEAPGMTDATALLTTAAPAPVGPYSQAIRSGGFIFCSGQVGLDPATGKLVEGGLAPQTHRTLANLRAVLTAAGRDLSAIVKTTVFLADMADFAAFNAIYADYFPGLAPARSTFQVAGLPLAARIEIECIATAR